MNQSFSEPEFRNSFETLQPRLLDIPDADLITPNIRIREASHVALGITEVAHGPTWRPRFEKLAQGEEWNIAYLDDLAPTTHTL